MRDDQLLQDLATGARLPDEKYDWLGEHKITTYSKLFAFIQDEANATKLRWEACYVVHRLWKVVDTRRAVPCLLAALNASDEKVRCAAANALGMLKSKRAVLPLTTILADKTQSVTFRHWSIDGLNLIGDKRAIPLFWQIIDDPNEHVEIRSRALEMMFERPEPIDKFIALLSDPTPDIRFWAAYCLAFISPPSALSKLDRVVAFDHELPLGFGWQVSREAMLPLETIYYRKLLGFYDHRSNEDYPWYGMGGVYLISPAPEYDTLSHEYRQQGEDYHYISKPLPEIKLKIEPDWLAEKLHENWPEIRLNIRQPRPQAYLLDWHLQIGEAHVIGALHRDQYAVVLTGQNHLIMAFAAWYRGLFPLEQRLYLYRWADPHVELRHGMLAEEIEKVSDRATISAMEISAEDLTFE